MKNNWILIILLGLAACNARKLPENKVPSVVLNTLKASYPMADKVEWESHKGFFEAELDVNDSTDATARIDKSGKLVGRKTDISLQELPLPVVNALQSQFGDYTVEDAEKLELDGTVYYQLELEGKGRKDKNVVLTVEGLESPSVSYWD